MSSSSTSLFKLIQRSLRPAMNQKPSASRLLSFSSLPAISKPKTSLSSILDEDTPNVLKQLKQRFGTGGVFTDPHRIPYPKPTQGVDKSPLSFTEYQINLRVEPPLGTGGVFTDPHRIPYPKPTQGVDKSPLSFTEYQINLRVEPPLGADGLPPCFTKHRLELQLEPPQRTGGVCAVQSRIPPPKPTGVNKSPLSFTEYKIDLQIEPPQSMDISPLSFTEYKIDLRGEPPQGVDGSPPSFTEHILEPRVEPPPGAFIRFLMDYYAPIAAPLLLISILFLAYGIFDIIRSIPCS